MSRRGNRSFLSWLFLQQPIPRKVQKKTEMVFDNENQAIYIHQDLQKPSVTPSATEPSIPLVQASSSSPQVNKFCTGCGKSNTEMKNFCKNCGKDLRVV